MPFIKTDSSPRADDSVSMLTPHHSHHSHTLPTFHNLNPHYNLTLSSPSPSHSLSHAHSVNSHGFSPYTSPRHSHIPASVFDSSNHNSSSHAGMSSHDIQELSHSSASSAGPSSHSVSASASAPLPVVDDALYNYVASAASLEGMSAEEMLRNPNVMLAVRQAMSLNLAPPQQAYMPTPQSQYAQPLHHAHSLLVRSLPGSPLPLTMPTPPAPSFHSLAADGSGHFVPSSPVAGPVRSPSLLGSGRSKRLRMDETEQRALGSHMSSPAPLAVLPEDCAHNPSASAVSNCPPPSVAHLNSMFAQSLPFGAPLMPMMPPLPPMLHNRTVEHSMLMDSQPTPSPTAASAAAAASSSSHAGTDPALLLMRQHHHQQQQQLINFNHLLLRGLGGFGTTMATPISSASLPTISAVALSSPSSVFASQRSVTSVSPAPSLSSVSSASSPSLATPTKSCFSRTSSSASSTPRTDDSSLDSFHSSRFSDEADDSEMHLPDCEKPFSCSDCHKRFSNESRLANHRRTHNNSRPYECRACNKQFNHKGSLTRHMRTHSGDKPHVCNQCGKRFFQPGNLTVHIRTHTGERPFECDRCGRRFNHRSSLTVHQRSHI